MDLGLKYWVNTDLNTDLNASQFWNMILILMWIIVWGNQMQLHL